MYDLIKKKEFKTGIQIALKLGAFEFWNPLQSIIQELILRHAKFKIPLIKSILATIKYFEVHSLD